MEDIQDLSLLREKSEALPLKPGVYLMRDRQGKVIYVGKSRALKNRVSQYFHGEHDVKTSRMVQKVRDFSFIVCDTEMEALALENRLIKQYCPRYNIKLKDAKSYPYLALDTKESYPRLRMTRTRLDDGKQYFGPFSGVAAVYSILNEMERIFRLPSCSRSFPKEIGKERPCMYYQTGRCMGVCTGGVSVEEYRGVIENLISVLKGNLGEAIDEAKGRMEKASEDLRFEEAARIRDSIEAMKKLTERQKAVGSPSFACDLFALSVGDVGAAVSAFFIRNGYITDTQHFLFGKDEIVRETFEKESGDADPDATPLSAFLYDLYISRTSAPSEILLSFRLPEEEREALEKELSGRFGRKISLRTPERGQMRKLCDMAEQDAEKHLENELARAKKDDKILISLAAQLALETVPDRIEVFDISSYGNESITAGMIVARHGTLSRRDYRTFRIRTKDTQDDYAAMTEAVMRRVSHIGQGSDSLSERPDLILLDGGKGHVSVVRRALETAGAEIPVFGLVKDEHHKTRTVCSDTEEIRVARDMSVFRFLYGLQEEVHRYTVRVMDSAKRKTLKHSTLEKIPGIGPKKAKILLSHFGTLATIKKATPEELSRVKGISVADAARVAEAFSAADDGGRKDRT